MDKNRSNSLSNALTGLQNPSLGLEGFYGTARAIGDFLTPELAKLIRGERPKERPQQANAEGKVASAAPLETSLAASIAELLQLAGPGPMAAGGVVLPGFAGKMAGKFKKSPPSSAAAPAVSKTLQSIDDALALGPQRGQTQSASASTGPVITVKDETEKALMMIQAALEGKPIPNVKVQTKSLPGLGASDASLEQMQKFFLDQYQGKTTADAWQEVGKVLLPNEKKAFQAYLQSPAGQNWMKENIGDISTKAMNGVFSGVVKPTGAGGQQTLPAAGAYLPPNASALKMKETPGSPGDFFLQYNGKPVAEVTKLYNGQYHVALSGAQHADSPGTIVGPSDVQQTAFQMYTDSLQKTPVTAGPTARAAAKNYTLGELFSHLKTPGWWTGLTADEAANSLAKGVAPSNFKNHLEVLPAPVAHTIFESLKKGGKISSSMDAWVHPSVNAAVAASDTSVPVKKSASSNQWLQNTSVTRDEFAREIGVDPASVEWLKNIPIMRTQTGFVLDTPGMRQYVPKAPNALTPNVPPAVGEATRESWRAASPYTTPAYRGSGQPTRQSPSADPSEFFSAANPELANLYAQRYSSGFYEPNSVPRRPQSQPLMLDTRDYLTYDAQGAGYSMAQDAARAVMRQQKDKKYKGVVFHNVYDEPDGGSATHNMLGSPQTVYMTLPGGEHTIRSKFAQFNPAKYGERDLLAGISGGGLVVLGADGVPYLLAGDKE